MSSEQAYLFTTGHSKREVSHSSMASSSATEITTFRLKQPLHFYSVANGLCCDICQPVCPYSELTISPVTLETRKHRPRTRSVPVCIQSSLETKLLVERDALIAKNPALKMLPKSVICPQSVIKEVCSRSPSINLMRLFPCVRPEFHLPFFNAVVECLNSVGPPKRSHTFTS